MMIASLCLFMKCILKWFGFKIKENEFLFVDQFLYEKWGVKLLTMIGIQFFYKSFNSINQSMPLKKMVKKNQTAE